MRATKIVALAMAAMLLLGGVAAVGGATPADQATGTATDAGADDASDESDDASAASDDRDGVGPSDGLPAKVPDHVSGIHDRIGSFLNGSTDDLGASLSEFLGGGEQADAGDDQSADDDQTADDDADA